MHALAGDLDVGEPRGEIDLDNVRIRIEIAEFVQLHAVGPPGGANDCAAARPGAAARQTATAMRKSMWLLVQATSRTRGRHFRPENSG